MLVALLAAIASLAPAHKDHDKAQPVTQVVQPAVVSTADPAAMHAQMGRMMDEVGEDRAKMTTLKRVLNWLGRLHPMVVLPDRILPGGAVHRDCWKTTAAFGKPVQSSW